MVSGSDIVGGMIGAGFNNVPDFASSSSRDRRLQYWRSCPGCERHTEQHNWIILGPVMGPTSANAFVDFQNSKHATPLTEYGQYLSGMNRNNKYDITEARQRFNYLIEGGGIGEFPVDQMIAYNWHRFPIIVKARPELEFVEDIACQHGCSNRLFTSESSYHDHISVIHKEVAQPEAIGRHFESAIKQMGNQQVDAATIAAIVAAVREAMTPEVAKK